ncbi:hypothetical protein AgCh_004142 [Apium graveolens]
MEVTDIGEVDGSKCKPDLGLTLRPNKAAPQFYNITLNGLEIFKLSQPGGNLAAPNSGPVPSPPTETNKSGGNQKFSIIPQEKREISGCWRQVDVVFTAKKKKKVIWIIESGYSRHMTGDMTLLSQFEEKAGPLVTFGDNNKSFIMEYGKLIYGNVVIEDVALVALQTKDPRFYLKKGECTFISKKTGEVVLKGVRKGSLFVANLDSANEDEICSFYTKASVEQSKL